MKIGAHPGLETTLDLGSGKRLSVTIVGRFLDQVQVTVMGYVLIPEGRVLAPTGQSLRLAPSTAKALARELNKHARFAVFGEQARTRDSKRRRT